MLGALLRLTVEKYRMLTALKEIRLSTSEKWWCWLCLCRVALLVLHIHRCKTKLILWSRVGFVMIHHHHTALRCEFKIYLSFHTCFTQAYLPDVVEAVESEAQLDVMYVVYPATRNYPRYCLWDKSSLFKIVA